MLDLREVGRTADAYVDLIRQRPDRYSAQALLFVANRHQRADIAQLIHLHSIVNRFDEAAKQ
jgi:hypothetical protein